MTTQQPSILVGCDGSPESMTALAWAADHARRANGSLRLVTCWEWPTLQGAPITYGQWDPESDCRARLARLQQFVDLPAERVTSDVIRGHPAWVLVHRANDYDLLVVGTHGQGAVSRLILGSVSAHCASRSPVPVAIVRPESGRGVLVGVDGSESAREALRWAMDYADANGEPLTVMQAVEPSVAGHAKTRQALHELVAKEDADRGRLLTADVRIRVIDGNPAQVLVEQSKHAGVTVVGRRGGGGFHRLLVGSVAAALSHHGQSTVVLTPGP